MTYIETAISEFRNEADRDFISLCLIAGDVEYDLAVTDQQDIRDKSLQIIRGLMDRDVYPGDYMIERLKTAGFFFWIGTPDQLLKRIETEWIALGKSPTLAKPICWFALRPAHAEVDATTKG